ncbi:MAG: radical SAM protein [Victivallales bacterium]|nr:radical SAM protein [Victivallales bacterium]
MEKYQHLFGPLMSRRFGRSLGIDLCPMKTCSYDCVFCQLGSTGRKTIKREEFFPLPEICGEIASWLRADGKADYITLAGSGEPTLYSRFGELIDFIHGKTDIPVLLLTNGSLLWQPEVRRQAAAADVVKLSMSVRDQASFEIINRPDPAITFENMVAGEIAFRKEYKGRLVLEVFLLEGINAEDEVVRKITGFTDQIRPDTIHLNTVTRPAAEGFARPVGREKLEHFAAMFTPPAEIPAEISGTPVSDKAIDEEKVLALIRRRPVTLQQLAATFGIHPNEMAKLTGRLLRDGKIVSTNENGNRYFKFAVDTV